MTLNLNISVLPGLNRTARRLTTWGVIACAAGVLSGCVSYTAQSPLVMISNCMSDREDIVADADWDQATPLDAHFLNGELHPMVLYVESNKPYVLKVRNLDRSSNNLWAPDFLKQGVALDSIQMGDKTPAKGCVNGVRVEARSSVTLKFVPVYEGRYEVSASGFPVVPGQLTDGVINIIEPRVGGAVN